MPEIQTLGDMAADSAARDKQPGRPGEPVSADRQIAAYFERREKERLAKRKVIRAGAQERDRLMQTVTDLEAQLRLLDQRADAAAEKHQAACEPIQAALAGATGAKRAALLEKLTTINLDLERELDVVNRVRGPMLKQHRDVRTAAAGLPTEQQLSGGDLAAPELRCELFVTKQRLAASEQRISRARDWVSAFDRQLSLASSTPARPMMFGWHAEHGKVALDFDRINLLEFRLSKWRAELLDAEHERHECLSEMQRISTEMIAE